MAYVHVITVLFFALVLARIELFTCQMVQGKVSCVDCPHNYHLSDINVSLKCQGVKNLAMTTTKDDGSFKINLPSDHTKTSMNCFATLLGGPSQLYASKQNQVSQIIIGKENNNYTISTPLSFMISCPKNTNCKALKPFGSSKTVDIPLPPEWGLAPSSYYVPFFPIIGIP